VEKEKTLIRTCTSTYTNRIEMSNEKCVPVTHKFMGVSEAQKSRFATYESPSAARPSQKGSSRKKIV